MELVYELNITTKETNETNQYFKMAYDIYIKLVLPLINTVEIFDDTTNILIIYGPYYSSVTNDTKVSFYIFINGVQSYNFTIEKRESNIILINNSDTYILSNNKTELEEKAKSL